MSGTGDTREGGAPPGESALLSGDTTAPLAGKDLAPAELGSEPAPSSQRSPHHSSVERAALAEPSTQSGPRGSAFDRPAAQVEPSSESAPRGSAFDRPAAQTELHSQSSSRGSPFERDFLRDTRKRDALAQRETLPIARPPDTDDTIPDRPDLADQTSEMPLGALLGSDGASETSGWGSLLLRRRGSFFRTFFFRLFFPNFWSGISNIHRSSYAASRDF